MAARLNSGPLLFGIAVATFLPVAASAEELPVNVPANAAASSVGNFYVWAEGPWGPVRSPQPGSVPTMSNNEPVGGTQTTSVDPNPVVFGPPSADSMRGGIGYVFPDGTFPSALGSKTRLEIGASQTSTSVGTLPGNQNASIGTGTNGVLLGGCTGCTGSLSTTYSGTRTSLKAASDYNVAGVTLTPSVSLYNSNNRQEFSPSVSSDPGGTMTWKDTGTAIGLESKVNLAPALTLNVGGNVGIVNREASLTPSTTDAATARRGAAPRTGSAEARLTYKPAEEFELNSFAGLKNYDSHLPGISASSGSTPQIKYGPDAGYYVGAGATFRFQSKD